MRHGSAALLAALLSLVGGATARAEVAPGAVIADRPIATGGLAIAGWVGWPAVGVTYRLGTAGIELGGDARFDFAATTLSLDVPVRFPITTVKGVKVGAGAWLGLFGNLGSKWIEATQSPSAGLRAGVGADATWRPTQNVAVVGALEVPTSWALTERGSHRFGIRAGGGVELGMGDGWSLAGRALAGPDGLAVRGGQTSPRLGIDVLVGLGKRIF